MKIVRASLALLHTAAEFIAHTGGRSSATPRESGSCHSAIPRGHTALCITLALAILASACSRHLPPTPAPSLDPARFDGTRAFTETAAIVAIGPRPSGSPGAEKTATHIADRLRAQGASVEIDTFTDDTPAGPITFRNVIGTFGHAGDPIVLLSHYDTKIGIDPAFVGANDSGSSTGLLLALAKILKDRPPTAPTILLAFVDGEECRQAYSDHDGLHGSRRLATQLTGTGKHIRAVILLDMVGDRDLTITIPRNSSPELVTVAFAAAQAEGVRHQFSLLRGEILDDHVPFFERQIPAIDLIDFQYGSAPGKNDYWHTPQDTLDKLSPESLQTMGRIVLRMLNTLEARPL